MWQICRNASAYALGSIVTRVESSECQVSEGQAMDTLHGCYEMTGVIWTAMRFIEEKEEHVTSV